MVRRLRGELRRGEVEIVVISADTVHNFHGFTGEVVAGLLPIGLTQTPLTEAMPKARVLHARVTHVDVDARTVTFTATAEIAYDALVVGTGGREPLDAVDGLAGHGLTLRGPGDLADLLQRVRVVDGPVVVVGGGLAGVELAAALAARDGAGRAGPVGGPGGARAARRAPAAGRPLHARSSRGWASTSAPGSGSTRSTTTR